MNIEELKSEIREREIDVSTTKNELKRLETEIKTLLGDSTDIDSKLAENQREIAALELEIDKDYRLINKLLQDYDSTRND